MIVNVAVSLPRRHPASPRWRGPRTRLLPILAPATLAAIFLGVSISNLLPGHILAFILAIFLILYCGWNLRMIARPRRRVLRRGPHRERSPARFAHLRRATGLLGGPLGLGGGFLMVPLLQLVCNLRLKNAIATTSPSSFSPPASTHPQAHHAPQHHESIRNALIYIACMAPTGIVGALLARSSTRSPSSPSAS